MSEGDLLQAGMRGSPQQSQQNAAAIAAGSGYFERLGEAELRNAEAQRAAAQAQLDFLKKAASTLGQKAKQGAEWYGEQEIRRAEMEAQAAQAQVDWAKQQLQNLKAKAVSWGEWLSQKANQVKQAFGEVKKALDCPPCYYDQNFRPYKRYQGKMLRICTDENGNQTVQEVERNPDGKSYRVVGEIKPNATDPKFFQGEVWKEPERLPPSQQYNVPTPAISHVNGLAVSPTSGLQDAMMLQREVRRGCKGKADKASGGGGPEGPAGGPNCVKCDCVLYTYSENLQAGGDWIAAVGAKFGWEGKITESQANQMRDAIMNGKQIVMSAHSRGSEFTNQAWKNVFNEQKNWYRTQPDAVAAGDRAYQEALMSGDPDMSPGLARMMAQDAVASRNAAKQMNDHVMVLNSGNAVWVPNQLQDGRRVVTTSRYSPITTDVISIIAGTTPFGLKTVPVDIAAEKPVAEVNRLTINRETGANEGLHNWAHHTYGEWYVRTVGQLACDPNK